MDKGSRPGKAVLSEPRTLVSHPELASQKSFPFFQTVGEKPKSALERLLSLFADVRAGEGVLVLLLSLNVFLVLAGYNVMKPARDALSLTEVGATVKAYSSGAMAALLMLFIPLYGWLASRVPRIRLIVVTSLFFSSNLVIFYLLGQANVRVGVAFFIWIGIYNNFAVSQIWAFANDLYTEGQGRRLFPLIGVGASLGAWIGAATVGPSVRSLGFTAYTLMLMGAGALLVTMCLTILINRKASVGATADPENARTNEVPLGKEGGFALIFRDRYLFWIAILIVLLNAVNTLGGFLLDSLVVSKSIEIFGGAPEQLGDRRAWITVFSGSFITTVNFVGLIVQLFLTSRIFRYLGVRGALFILPVLALLNYTVIAVVPLLALVRIGKVLENATDYSLQNTIRHALFLPTTREAKYKAKAAVDTFFARTGDVLQAGIVGVGSALSFSTPAFAWVNVVLTLAWIGAATRIAKEHRRKTL